MPNINDLGTYQHVYFEMSQAESQGKSISTRDELSLQSEEIIFMMGCDMSLPWPRAFGSGDAVLSR